jgi:hypothetical protein
MMESGAQDREIKSDIQRKMAEREIADYSIHKLLKELEKRMEAIERRLKVQDHSGVQEVEG